jgi:hypothetical protein
MDYGFTRRAYSNAGRKVNNFFPLDCGHPRYDPRQVRAAIRTRFLTYPPAARVGYASSGDRLRSMN